MKRTVVLVVEDEPLNRLMAIDALERGGFEVLDFGRTDEALVCAERMPDRIAALVTDIHVPGDQDGIDLALWFADRFPESAVLVTSGRFGSSAPSDFPSSLDFIPKPWTPKALLGRVHDGVQRCAAHGHD